MLPTMRQQLSNLLNGSFGWPFLLSMALSVVILLASLTCVENDSCAAGLDGITSWAHSGACRTILRTVLQSQLPEAPEPLMSIVFPSLSSALIFPTPLMIPVSTALPVLPSCSTPPSLATLQSLLNKLSELASSSLSTWSSLSSSPSGLRRAKQSDAHVGRRSVQIAHLAVFFSRREVAGCLEETYTCLADAE